jgi:hypothetical protein
MYRVDVWTTEGWAVAQWFKIYHGAKIFLRKIRRKGRRARMDSPYWRHSR